LAPLSELVSVSHDAKTVCEFCGVDPSSVAAPVVSSTKAVTDMASSDASTDVGSQPDTISDAEAVSVSRTVPGVGKSEPKVEADLFGVPCSQVPIVAQSDATNVMQDLLDFDSPQLPQVVPQENGAGSGANVMQDLLDFDSPQLPQVVPQDHGVGRGTDDLDLLDFGNSQIQQTSLGNTVGAAKSEIDNGSSENLIDF